MNRKFDDTLNVITEAYLYGKSTYNRRNFKHGWLVIVKFNNIAKKAVVDVFLGDEDIDFAQDQAKSMMTQYPDAAYAEIYKRMDSTNHWSATGFIIKKDGTQVERTDGVCMIGTGETINNVVKSKFSALYNDKL